MSPLDETPFAVLTLIAAPAVLTNATSVLVLSTSNRFARAIDRARALTAQLEKKPGPADDPLRIIKLRQLDRAEVRALLLLRALRSFYLSLGALAGSALSSLFGAALTSSRHEWIYKLVVVVSAGGGLTGVGALVFGCVVLVRETRLALVSVSEEADFLRLREHGERITLGDPLAP